MKKRALLSVSDKNGLIEFARELVDLNYEIISTGGTFSALECAGIKCIAISDITNFPECLDGRVKTLHPNVHAGVLAVRSNDEHMAQLKKLDINTIDIVAVNLYPFKQTISKKNVTLQDAIENIDIGGPTMIRSAAKNYQDVYAICDPSDYNKVVEDIKKGSKSLDLKFNLMYKVYQHTAYYDTLIANFLKEKQNISYPDKITFAYEKVQDLRYGENPHQHAAFYKEDFKIKGTLSEAVQLHGKELSYNNINDTNGAIALVKEFSEPCVVAVKHANPCGVGIGENIFEAYKKAYEVDTISIFGGIIAANGIIDELAAAEINKIFIEIVIAKGYTEKALEILKQKKNIRILELKNIDVPFDKEMLDMKRVGGGLLVQQYDDKLYNADDIEVVTKIKPTEKQLKDLELAFKIVKHTKSNAIVLTKDGVSVGIGAGQTNRIWATQQAIEHAGDKANGSVLASDAFFPFSDCVEAAYKGGIKAIIQPGGSIRDKESIEACDKYGIAMVFCKMRHFKH